MKLSVSIPDELWMQAKILNPELGNSELIQMALGAFVKDAEPTEEQLREFWNKIKREV